MADAGRSGRRGVLASAASLLALAITTAGCGEVSIEKDGAAAGAAGMPEEVFSSSLLTMLRENTASVFVYGTGDTGEIGLTRVDKETGDVSFVAKELIDDFAVTESDIYFVWRDVCLECPPAPGFLHRVSVGGGAVTTLATVEGMTPIRVAAGGDSVFFTVTPYDSLYRVPTAGGAPEVIVPSGVHPYHLAVDPPFVFFVQQDTNTIMAFDWKTNNAAPIAEPSTNLNHLKVRNGHLYWETDLSELAISRVEIGVGEVEEVAGDVMHAGYFDAAEALYLTEWGEWDGKNYSNGRLVRAELDGEGKATLAQGLRSPQEIVAGGSHAYWVESKNLSEYWLMRLPKY